MNYYERLGCDPNAPHDDIKRSYQRLAKASHPDKTGDNQEEFVEIDEAWKVLRDPETRRKYDASLCSQHLEETPLIHAEVDIRELVFDGRLTASYVCRCGETFRIETASFVDGEDCIFECAVCSNCILVKNR